MAVPACASLFRKKFIARTSSCSDTSAFSVAVSSPSPQQRSEHTAHDLAADARANGSRGALGRGLDQTVLATAAAHQSFQRTLDRVEDAAALRGVRGRCRGRTCAATEELVSRLA